MEAAQGLYVSMGFKPATSYYVNPLPNVKYYSLDLHNAKVRRLDVEPAQPSTTSRRRTSRCRCICAVTPKSRAGSSPTLPRCFSSTLLFPGTRLTALHTKRPGEGARLNMGDFTSSRWKAAQKKILNGDYAVVTIEAETPDFPSQKIWFTSHVNPIGRDEFLVAGTWKVYVQRLVPAAPGCVARESRSPAGCRKASVERNAGRAGVRLWESGHHARAADVRSAHAQTARGSPSVGIHSSRRFERCMPCQSRMSATTSKETSSSSTSETAASRARFWANFLSAAHVAMAGGEAALETKLNGMRVEPLEHGGLLVVATDSPLPEDTDATRERFWRLDEALQPASFRANRRQK